MVHTIYINNVLYKISFDASLGNGKRGNRWSQATIRIGKVHSKMIINKFQFIIVALAVFVRSPAAYEALKKLQHFSAACKKHFAGVYWMLSS